MMTALALTSITSSLANTVLDTTDKDAFSLFEESGNVWNKDLATKFKQTFLEMGGKEEPMVLYQQFMGRQPNNAAFLRGRGL